MTFKRKRNIKFEALSTYNVFFLETFNTDEIEDYEETKATGMEEDEEKEVHLQNVIKGKDKEIPLPVFSKVSNHCKYQEFKLKNFINDQKDAKNRFILNKKEVEELNRFQLNDNNAQDVAFTIKNDNKLTFLYEQDVTGKMDNSSKSEQYDFEAAIITFGEDIKYCNCVKNVDYVNFVLRKTLIRYEKKGYEAYTCFKPRIIMPKIKSRKNEQQTIDKLRRMYKEFLYLENSCKIASQKIGLDKECTNKKTEMVVKYGNLFTSSIRKKLNYKKEKLEVGDLYYSRKKYKKEEKEVFLSDVFYYKNTDNIEQIDRNSYEDIDNVEKEKKMFNNRFNCELK